MVRCLWSLLSGDKESLNGPHTKILEKRKKERKEKPNKRILLMVLNNGVVRGSHGHDVWGSHGCACGVDTWFPWMAYERPMDDALMK